MANPSSSVSNGIRGLALLLLLLLAGVPYASTRDPLPLTKAVWATSEGTARMMLVAMALSFALAGIAIAVLCSARRDASWGAWSLACASFALGIGCYPLWLNGVADASPALLHNQLDPKQVAPFVWFRSLLAYPQLPFTFAMFGIAGFTPFISTRVVVRLRAEGPSWSVLAESALPLAWIFLHRSIIAAWAWSFD